MHSPQVLCAGIVMVVLPPQLQALGRPVTLAASAKQSAIRSAWVHNSCSRAMRMAGLFNPAASVCTPMAWEVLFILLFSALL